MKPAPENLSPELYHEIIIVGSIPLEKVNEQYKLDLLADPRNAVLHASYGHFLEDTGHLEDAGEELKTSLDIDPQRISTHVRYGRLLFRLGRPEEAEKEFKFVLEIDPKNVAAHTNYGFLLQEANRLEEAEREYKLALLVNSNDITVCVNYGALLNKMNRLEDAEEQYKKALDVDPKNPAVHSNYGVVLHRMDRINEAEEQHKLALKYDPKSALIHYNYGIFLNRLGRLDEAKKEFKIALDIDPKNPNYNYHGLDFKIDNYNEFKNAIHRDYGFLLDKMSRPEEAEKEFKTALKIDPKNSYLHYYYGEFLYENNRYEDAEREYNLSLAFDSKNSDAHSSYAILLNKKGMIEEAEEHYEVALEIDPKNSDLHYYYGEFLHKNNRREDAEREYNLALAFNSKNLGAHSSYAILLNKKGMLEEAEEHYKIALEIDRRNSTNHNNYGYLLNSIGQIDKAEEHYKIALEIDPQNITVHLNYSNLLHRTDRFEEAEKHYEFLLSQGLKNRDLNYNYVHLLYDMDRLKEAAKQCKVFLKADPKDAHLHYLYCLIIIHLPRSLSDRSVIKEMEKAARLYAESGDNLYEHLTKAVIYDALAYNYYQWAQLYNIKETNSKCWKYTDISGDEYLEAGKHSGEISKGELLEEGYTQKGRAKVRKSVLYTIYPNESSDNRNFKQIISDLLEASEFYKKAAEVSTEENNLCNACSISMLVFADMLDCMKAVIEKGTFPKLDDKVSEWESKLTYLNELYIGNKKGELFVDSLYKAMYCIKGLKMYKEDATVLDDINVKKCIMELIDVTNNIEGPLQKIFLTSVQQMDTHREQIISWDGSKTPHVPLPEPEPSALKKFQIKTVNMLKLVIKHISSLILATLIAIIGVIVTKYNEIIINLFNAFISYLSNYF